MHSRWMRKSKSQQRRRNGSMNVIRAIRVFRLDTPNAHIVGGRLWIRSDDPQFHDITTSRQSPQQPCPNRLHYFTVTLLLQLIIGHKAANQDAKGDWHIRTCSGSSTVKTRFSLQQAVGLRAPKREIGSISCRFGRLQGEYRAYLTKSGREMRKSRRFRSRCG
jgi:hypothetical protein